MFLIVLIQRSTIQLLHFLEQPVCWEPINGVDIYLYYTQIDAQAFYQSCGFLWINESTSSGFELLPKSISVTQVQEENGGLHGFHLIQMNMPAWFLLWDFVLVPN